MTSATKLNYTISKGRSMPPLWIESPISAALAGLKAQLEFSLPAELEASEPPEARGLARDEVRLMVSQLSDNQVTHTQFQSLPDYLEAGDLVVINTSGTMKAAIEATRADGTLLEVHLSTRLPANLWIVELRQADGNTTQPFSEGVAGEKLNLPGNVSLTLHTPHQPAQRTKAEAQVRLWIASIALSPNESINAYLDQHGFPIRYSYVNEAWPIDYYQSVYATEAGSAEMPSAGRAFTPELITRLVAKGVQIAPLVLHTGVASLESHEPPYEEFYRVPASTARLVNETKKTGKRVIAVGTSVVRALESVTADDGLTYAGEGWTDIIITPERGIRSVEGMLTGLHEAQATHLAMLQTLANLEHLQITYTEALQQGYLWHEFGDLHLILP